MGKKRPLSCVVDTMVNEEFRPLSYLIDTKGSRCVLQHSWRKSTLSKKVLCEVVDQGETCFCYGLTTSEASRGVINLKTNQNAPKLSSMEVVRNCYGKACKGYYASNALEWILKKGIIEDSVMPLDLNFIPNQATEGLSAFGKRYSIDNWEAIQNIDADIKCISFRQPVVVSLLCPPDFFENYRGGLIDPYLMEAEAKENANKALAHSMLLTGFGYYVYPDRSRKYFWELKNSSGVKCGKKGYIHILRNSSQPTVDEWVTLDPMVPLVFRRGEEYQEKNLVEDMSFEQLAKIERNINLDLVILFYDGIVDKRPFFKIFERASRLYLPDKDDVKFIQVSTMTEKRTGKDIGKFLPAGYKISCYPVMLIYKYKQGAKPTTRSLSRDGKILEGSNIDFEKMATFLIEKVGGPIGSSCLL